MLSMTSNFDNEVEILRSRTLIKKVVSDMGLYIDMEESNALGFNPPLYKNSPVNVFITPEEADRLVAPVELRMRYTWKEGGLVRAEYKIDKEGDWETMEQGFDRLPRHIAHPRGVFSFTCMDSIPELEGGEIELVAHVHTPTSTAEAYGKELSVTPLVQDDDDRQGILEEHGEATRRGLHQSPCVVLQPGRQRREERGGAEDGGVHRGAHRHHQRRAGHYGERARCLQATLRPDEFDERRPDGFAGKLEV